MHSMVFPGCCANNFRHMMAAENLFRTEAIDSQRPKWMGEIVMIRPVSLNVAVAFAAVVVIGIVIFLNWGSYTRRTIVSGQLIPEEGIVKIHAPQVGMVLERNITEGKVVSKGDVLYVLSSDRQSTMIGENQATISAYVRQQQSLIHNEISTRKALYQEEYIRLRAKIRNVKTELVRLDEQILFQMRRFSIAEEITGRYRDLLAAGYISTDQAQQKEGELLDQRQKLKMLERDREALRRELNTIEGDLDTLPLRQHNQISEYERKLMELGQALSESEANRKISILAPRSGIATALLAKVGQVIDSSRPLLTIVPASASLEAQLYVPSSAMGFVKIGDPVLLRYKPFPYQKFGQHSGAIASISRSAIPLNELATASGGVPGIDPAKTELYYQVTVKLASQSVQAYGKDVPLLAGTLVEASLLHENRRLYEWILEPIYTLRGALKPRN
ncbi:HlyD family secretion protein [Cupriavidus necator]|uniref:HlyD family secretion protein n=1 Tax=Cupriavidus necator TaxID=106590 RepID=UPI00277F731F|nr:HlyD family efflux transporter periplasmic adaptor subunit [Cupriavidus necator]MDQ0142629.1 membrane fusion protein [Cupriavidus necator]